MATRMLLWSFQSPGDVLGNIFWLATARQKFLRGLERNHRVRELRIKSSYIYPYKKVG